MNSVLSAEHFAQRHRKATAPGSFGGCLCSCLSSFCTACPGDTRPAQPTVREGPLSPALPRRVLFVLPDCLKPSQGGKGAMVRTEGSVEQWKEQPYVHSIAFAAQGT